MMGLFDNEPIFDENLTTSDDNYGKTIDQKKNTYSIRFPTKNDAPPKYVYN